jgi:hypothetical protein
MRKMGKSVPAMYLTHLCVTVRVMSLLDRYTYAADAALYAWVAINAVPVGQN